MCPPHAVYIRLCPRIPASHKFRELSHELHAVLVEFRPAMDAWVHYSRPLLLQPQQGPAASPAPALATTAGAVPDARTSVPAAPGDAFTFLNANAIVILALLVCGLVVALALHVVLTCALRVTRRACRHSGAGDDAPQGRPEHSSITGGGGGGPEQQQAAARHGGQKQPRRLTKLVRALPCLAYSSGLELAGSSRSECAICLAAFARGEAVRVLPRCNHGFHARCIDRWLASRPTCPTCRQAPFAQTTALLQPDDDGTGEAPAAVPLVRVVIVGDRVARLMEP